MVVNARKTEEAFSYSFSYPKEQDTRVSDKIISLIGPSGYRERKNSPKDTYTTEDGSSYVKLNKTLNNFTGRYELFVTTNNDFIRKKIEGIAILVDKLPSLTMTSGFFNPNIPSQKDITNKIRPELEARGYVIFSVEPLFSTGHGFTIYKKGEKIAVMEYEFGHGEKDHLATRLYTNDSSLNNLENEIRSKSFNKSAPTQPGEVSVTPKIEPRASEQTTPVSEIQTFTDWPTAKEYLSKTAVTLGFGGILIIKCRSEAKHRFDENHSITTIEIDGILKSAMQE